MARQSYHSPAPPPMMNVGDKVFYLPSEHPAGSSSRTGPTGFEVELSFYAGTADAKTVFEKALELLDDYDVRVLKESPKRAPPKIPGGYVRADFVVWRANNYVYISLRRSSAKQLTDPIPPKLILKAYMGNWAEQSKRAESLYLRSEDFELKKVLTPSELTYINLRATRKQTNSVTAPANDCTSEIEQFEQKSAELAEKLGGKRKRVTELDAERERLSGEINSIEAEQQRLNNDYKAVLESRSRFLQQKLQEKKNKYEYAQKEYEKFKANAEKQLQNISTFLRCTETDLERQTSGDSILSLGSVDLPATD